MTSGALLVVQPARAAWAAGTDPPVVASLAVAGPADCAGRAEVVRLVARRSARIRFDDGAASGPALRVAVDAATPGAVAASLSIVWPDGARSERNLSAPTCAETADAIALVVVLALDPAAASREPPAARPAAPSRTEAAPPAPRARERPATAEPSHAPPAEPPAPAPEPALPIVQATVAPPPPTVEPSVPAVHRWDVGAAFRMASGPAPSLMPGFGLIAGWERDTASVLSWKVELIAAHHAGDVASADGTGRVTLDLVTLRVCPVRVGPRVVRARLCAGGSAGRLFAEGVEALPPRSRSRPFAAVGAGASLAVSPHPRVEVTASIDPQVALIRDQYAFGAANVFYEVPALTLLFGLGAAMTFQ